MRIFGYMHRRLYACTPTGRVVKCLAANSNLKACSLECGGKAPVIVFENGAVEKAAGEWLSRTPATEGSMAVGGWIRGWR